MKVLHVAAGNLFGGIETMLITMARERRKAPDLKPAFGVCFEGRLAKELRETGVEVHGFGAVQVRKPWTVYRARRSCREFLERNRMDVVICHSAWPLAVFGSAIRKTGTRLVLWLHDAVQSKHWVERWAKLTRPEMVICNSQYTAETVDRLFPGIRRAVIYCPVPAPPRFSAKERDALRTEFGANSKTVVIVMASRMQGWKGHRVLIDALPRLQSENDWRCWILGGPQRPAEERYISVLKKMVRQNHLSARVLFLGQRSDVAQVLQAADIYCQPNTAPEPFGIACVEALHAGLPLIVSDMGGTREIVNDSTGVRVPSGNAELVAKALQRFITNADQRRAAGMQGPRRAIELCDPVAIMERLRMVLSVKGTVNA